MIICLEWLPVGSDMRAAFKAGSVHLIHADKPSSLPFNQAVSLSPVSVDKSVHNSLRDARIGEMHLERPFCLFFNHCREMRARHYIWWFWIPSEEKT
jgi:hypothetical protein